MHIFKMRKHCKCTVDIFALVCTQLMRTNIFAIYITCIAFTSYLGICNHCKHNLVRSFHHIYTNIHTHIYRICRHVLHPLCTTLYIQPWWEGILCALAGNMYIHCNCKHKVCKCTKNDMLNSFHI